MNFLNLFEDRVSGIFGAAQAPFSFKKLAKQAAREMEDQTLVINGVNTAPALYTILIANGDDPLMAPFYPQLSQEVSELVKAQAEKKRYVFVGEPLVRFMIDPSLKSGKFSVFAENVDAPTLGRLYEEERAYQRGLTGSGAPKPAASHTPAPAPSRASDPFAVADPFAPQPVDPAAPVAGAAGAAALAQPLAAPIPVPKTMSRDQLSGLGGAAATGASLGTAGLAANLADARPRREQARPLGKLVDITTGQEHQLTNARVVVGRERGTADVALRDPNVSRRHAELTFTGSDWSIEDLNSTNGTLVNNRRISRCPLRDGDILTFGLTTFEFRS